MKLIPQAPTPGKNSKPVHWSRRIATASTIIALASFVPANAQTAPTPLTLPVSQDFGTTTFTAVPSGFAAWNGVSGAAVTTQAQAESSIPSGNATIAAQTAATTAGGLFGYASGGDAKVYVQTSSNATNGVNQLAMAVNSVGRQNLVLGYTVDIISAQPRTVGVVCQYRVGSTGAWTTITATTGSNPYSQAGGTAGLKTTVSATLPGAANNQPVVQVRWAFWRGTEPGNSSGAAIDNVSVTSDPAPVDTTSPTLVSFSPADETTNVLTTSNLTVTYDESIKAGTGNIFIRLSDGDPGTLVDTIPVTNTAQVQFSGATATINPSVVLSNSSSYYIEFAAGVFTDIAGNPAPAISGVGTWNFTTRAAPTVLISQYYDGLSSSKFLELRNLTAAPLSLDGYRLASWSPSDPDGNQNWKNGTGTTTRVTTFTSADVIPANGYYLVSDALAADPAYAVANNDLPLTFPSGMAFGGTVGTASTASVVLYSGASNDTASVVDAISIVGSEGIDISYFRKDNNVLPGFDFTVGTSITAYPTVWETKTLAEVASAATTDLWYLKASAEIQSLALSISPNSVSESANPTAAVGTVSRSVATPDPLVVTITSSDPSEATVPTTVTILENQTTATFDIAAVDDDYLDGDKIVTISVTAAASIPASQQITFLDEPTDAKFPVVINEVDADNANEFIELYNSSNVEQPLDDLFIVLYNGTGDVSYLTIDLDGFSIPANGYFVVGNANLVPEADLPVLASNSLQNGPEGVALYIGSSSSIPNGTAATTTAAILVDALVYGTSDADDTGLIAALTPGEPQVDENAGGNSGTNSMARLPNGGAAFDTSTYGVQAPTPGVRNSTITYANWSTQNASGDDPKEDTDGDGVMNGVEYFFGATGSTFTPNPVPNSSGTVLFPYDSGGAVGASYKVFTSPDLEVWTNVTANVSTATRGFLSYTLPAGQPKLFVRLDVAITP